MKYGIKKLATVIGLSSLLAAPAVLADEHKYELNVGGGKYFFDDDRNLENDPFWGVGLGYVVNPNWTLELWWTDSNLETDSGNVDVDGEEYRLDALYHFQPRNGFTPFVVAGVGEMNYDSSFGDTDETRINMGVGVKKAITERLGMRGDVRLYNGIDHEMTDYGVLVALNYKLGSVTPPAPKVIDSDGDGVADDTDACPGTPTGAAVDARGCPLDSDGDGVADYLDKCPGTAKNLKVDKTGCPLKLTKDVSIQLKVNFDNNSDVVKPAYMAEIKRVADFMNDYRNTTVEVQGHTDSYGAADYNQSLSQRRAEAVAKLLVSEFGISASRVSAKGYGETQLIASDSTREGREANRRVVAQIKAQVETMQKR